jgi:hypothetical protein
VTDAMSLRNVPTRSQGVGSGGGGSESRMGLLC